MANESSSDGISFFSILTIVFVVLKLTGYIDWSWFWVISPLLFFPAAILIVFLIAIIIKIIYKILK